jgi:hypothetical protein
MALNFKRDTVEYFEQKYMQFLMNNFPEYAKFWEENIGTEQRDEFGKPQLSRVLVTSDGKIASPEIERIRKQISQAHYSQFIHMIGVMREMDTLTSSASLGGITIIDKFAEIWFPFFNIYTHLDSIIDLEIFLWRSLLRLRDPKDWQTIAKLKAPAIIEKFALAKSVSEIAGVYNSINSVRNLLIHWTRVPVNLDVDPPIFIFPIRPLHILEDPPIWEETIDKGVAENPLDRATKDWNELLTAIGKLRRLYSDEIRNFLDSNGFIFKDRAAQQLKAPQGAPPSGGIQSNFAVTGSQNWREVNVQYTASGSTINHQYVTIK